MVGGTGDIYRDRVLRDLMWPWRRSTWWSLTHLTFDWLAGTISFTVIVTLLATSVGLLITFPLAIPVIWLLFAAAKALDVAERSRVAALLGVDLPDPVPPLTAGSWWGRLVERVRSGDRWRSIAYHLLALPRGVFTTVVVTLAWAGSAALLLLPLYVGAMPDDVAHFGLFDVTAGRTALALAAVGAVGLAVVAPWTTVGLARLDLATARWLLAPRRHDELHAQVTRLETSRAAAVDSAEAERRRIERDLHDGAQQRLVALAVDLGAAKDKLTDDPETGRRMVAAAHEEAKAALAEIRDLVRGIHPVILEDRGLDAALSAVVARSPVPVSLTVDVADRPPPAVESAAYFVVTEALTNVARHAHATKAAVAIARAGDRLVVEVRDDGVGGAAAAAPAAAEPSALDGTAEPGAAGEPVPGERRGTGLAGLRDRVTALGGMLRIVSPPGGPTTLLVELPCAS
jgi:signal transduction histidine kinase